MCEGFSEYSSVQKDRAATGRKRRVMDPAIVEATVRDLMPYGACSAARAVASFSFSCITEHHRPG